MTAKEMLAAYVKAAEKKEVEDHEHELTKSFHKNSSCVNGLHHSWSPTDVSQISSLLDVN